MKTNQLTSKITAAIVVIAILAIYACGSASQNQVKESNSEQEVKAEKASVMIAYGTKSQNARKAFDEGIEHYYLGNPETARKKFDKALALDPQFAMAMVYRAFNARSAKEFADYGKKLIEVRGTATESEKMMIDIYQTYLKRDVDLRMQLAKKLANTYPDDHMAQYELVNIYSNMDMQAESRGHLEGMVRKDPNNAITNIRLANSYLFDEPIDYIQAEKWAKKAVELKPKAARAHIMLGDVHRAKNDLPGALAAYDQAANTDKTNVIALSKKGHANTYLGNYEAALKDFNMAKSLTDNPMGMVMFSANTFLYQDKYEEALKHIDAEAAKIPNSSIPDDRKRVQSSTCANNCALIALYKRDGKRLAKYVKQLNALSDEITVDIGTEEEKTMNNAQKKLWEARVDLVNGDFKSAKQKTNAYKEMAAGFDAPYIMYQYHLNMGLIAMDQNDFATAVDHFKQTNKSNVFHQFHLAKALELNAQMTEANSIYKKWKDYNFNDTGYALVRNEIQSKAI